MVVHQGELAARRDAKAELLFLAAGANTIPSRIAERDSDAAAGVGAFA